MRKRETLLSRSVTQKKWEKIAINSLILLTNSLIGIICIFHGKFFLKFWWKIFFVLKHLIKRPVFKITRNVDSRGYLTL